MARFYKTASSRPIDYMYRINVPLMERVISANDQYIAQNLQQTQQLGEVANNFPYWVNDEERAKKIIEDYNNQVDSISDAIRQDPANWRKQLGSIRDLNKKLQQDYKVGEISKIAGNYSRLKNTFDYIDKQVESFNQGKQGISPEDAEAFKKYISNSFSGTNYDPKTGKYSLAEVFNPTNTYDVRKVLSEELDKLKAEKSKSKVTNVLPGEWYFNDITNEWEGITPERVLNIVNDRLMGNRGLLNSLAERTKVGALSGVFDDKGNFISPYNYTGIPATPEEQANIDKTKKLIAAEKNINKKQDLQSRLDTFENQIKTRRNLDWNENSYLAPIMRGIVSQYSYNQQDYENVLRNNSAGSTKYIQAQTNARQAAQLRNQKEIAIMRENGLNDRLQKNLDFQRWKHENPNTTKIEKSGVIPALPSESSISRLNTRSFEDWTTQDINTKQTVKTLSNAGLSSDISTFRTKESQLSKSIEETNKSMKDLLGNRSVRDLTPQELSRYNTLLLSKQEAERELPSVRSQLNLRRQWYKASVEAALSNSDIRKDGHSMNLLSEDEIKLYKKYTEDRQGKAMLKKIEDLADREGFLFKNVNTGTYYNRFTQWLDGIANYTPELRSARKEITEYFKVKDKVDKRREAFLDNMRYTPIDADAVKLGKYDSDYITNTILNNGRALNIFDNSGNKVSTMDNLISADNPLGIVGAKGYPIAEYIGTTTKIGNGGGIVELTYPKDERGKGGQTIYIELTPELQRQFATKLSSSNNPYVKSLGYDLADNEANSIRQQLITPKQSEVAGKPYGEPTTFTIFVDLGNQRVPFQVTKTFTDNSNTAHLDVKVQTDKGLVPLSGTPSGIDGIFNGPEEFIQYIKTAKASKK